jgi:hypothetical protein
MAFAVLMMSIVHQFTVYLKMLSAEFIRFRVNRYHFDQFRSRKSKRFGSACNFPGF